MYRKITLVMVGTLMLLTALPAFSEEDKISKVALETVRTQMRVPNDIEVKVMEKKESPIPDFYSVKLLLSAPDREIPIVIYVDKEGERVILGNLFVKGENVTRKEAGEPKARKIDQAFLEIEKSPIKGSSNGKVTIVEFSNFQCPFCARSWAKTKEWLDKYPQEIKYVFKHFPLQPQGKSFDFSEMVAAVQEVSPEAFWVIHDFLFTNEGQTLIKGEKEGVRQKIEQLLGEKGYDVKAFQIALEKGRGKKRVEEDMALGKKLQVRGTPTTSSASNKIAALPASRRATP